MKTLARRGAGPAAVWVLLGLGAAACSNTGPGFDLTRLIQPPGPLPSPGFSPDSPANALRLLEWCYNNRSLPVYRDLFSEDFRSFCSPLDSAGAKWRGTPWTREDELIFATHLFVGGGATEPAASSIRLSLDRNFFVYPDPDYTPWDPVGRWHKNIRTTVTLLILTGDGSSIEIFGHAGFSLVRGDSTAIPEELRLRGFGPDSSRWYIRRWDDETLQPGLASPGLRARGVAAAGRRPGELDAQPGSSVSWCQLRAMYR